MATRPNKRQREAQLEFDALSIEGGLLAPEWLAHAAQAKAPLQSDADYRIEKGLNLRDEIGRYWRIAQAQWSEFAKGRAGGAEPRMLSERFVHKLLQRCFGFESLELVGPVTVGDRQYPIGFSALHGRVPVVIAPTPATDVARGLEVQLTTFGESGRKRSAFGLAQEYLNAADGALWGIACDGLTLRILRDNASLTRPAWIEADLQRIFVEERFADFAALWLLAHETRFGQPDQPVADCALEQWREAGRQEGTRAREQLRRGVEEALRALGQGFLAHPDNTALRAALHDGSLSKDQYFQQLLRLVYRLIFLLTIEERGLLHPVATPEPTRKLYEGGYSLRRLRDRAVRRSAHDRFADLWQSLRIVFRGLVGGEPQLGLPALAGLFSAEQCAHLDAASLENRALLLAMFRLSWLREKTGLARVNWRDMGPEELGSVYESLLELVPQIGNGGRSFGFATGDEQKGNARKTTGSYYTPDSLVQVLLDSALEPVIEQTIAANPGRAVEALLELTVVDPACGSGHFLLAAARRLAGHVARLQTGGTPSAGEYRHALRQVVGRCIYGVDLNPMAVELCKVGLWMEAVEPGLPLNFLDAHIRHGNALLGATPELMAGGVPDSAWEPIEGDDRKVASALKKRNKQSASGQVGFETLWAVPAALDENASVIKAFAELEAAGDGDPVALAQKEAKFRAILESVAHKHQRFVADAWCSAFVWPKRAGAEEQAAPTNDLWRQLRDGVGVVPRETARIVGELADQYRFFHWHLAFPQVFGRGGFDCVLGNPPWETMSPDAKEFFSAYNPQIRFQDKEEQLVTIDRLLGDSGIAAAWSQSRRSLFGTVHFIKDSGRFYMFAEGNLGKGDFNVYRMFVELALTATRPGGRAAQIVPEGLYNGANCSAVRNALFDRCRLDLLLGFENAREVWFKAIDTRMKFAMYSASTGGTTHSFRCAFNIRSEAELPKIRAGNGLMLPVSMVREFSPDAMAIMELSDQRDIDIAAKMYRACPKLGDDRAGPPHRVYMRELDMGTDRELFGESPEGVPLYEGRMVAQFDHRAKGYRGGRGRAGVWEDLAFGRQDKSIQPQWRVDLEKVPEKVRPRMARYRIGFCDVASPTNERSLCAALLPPNVVSGDKVPTIVFDAVDDWAFMVWLAVANSFAMDFLARKKISLKMSYTVMDSLPFPRLDRQDPVAMKLVPLALRLSCCGPEMSDYWNAMADKGWCVRIPAGSAPPGAEDEDERQLLRAEIDAIVARDVYGLSAAEVEYILDTFPIVRERDVKRFGEFRTLTRILEAFGRVGKP